MLMVYETSTELKVRRRPPLPAKEVKRLEDDRESERLT
jgi:hypothetical protein